MFIRLVGEDYGVFASQCETTMTVGELIHELSKYEANLPIYLYDNYPGETHYHSITKDSVQESYLLKQAKQQTTK